MKSFLKIWIGISFMALFLGIGIVILAFASGGSWEDIPTYSVSDSYTNIEKIDFDIAYGKVTIVEGETFSIDAINLPEDTLESYESDGTWYIREKYDNDFNLFGSKMSLRQMIHWDGNSTPEITITLPEGFVADEFLLKVAAGEVEAEHVNAITGDFTVEAGRLYIGQIKITEKSQYKVSAGEMVLENTELSNISVDCGVGSVELDGSITGDSDITCGVGQVELNLDGDDSDYSYDISADIGSVEIDGNSYHSRDQRIDNETGNNLTLDCGIGNINVDFN